MAERAKASITQGSNSENHPTQSLEELKAMNTEQYAQFRQTIGIANAGRSDII
jgi:hypothetical protein